MASLIYFLKAFGLSTLLLAPAVSGAVNSTCYYPDGTTHSLGIPCEGTAAQSTCCEATHICLNNGLCLDTHYNHVIRVSCTDKTWSSISCPQYCQSYNPSWLADMRQCDNQNDNWICGQNTSACTSAKASSLFTVAFGLVQDSRSTSLTDLFLQADATTTATGTSSTGRAGTAATTTVTTTVMATGTTAPVSNGNTKTEAAIGAGIGIPLFAAFAVTLGLLLREKSLRRKEHGPVEMPVGEYRPAESSEYYAPKGPNRTHELHDEGGRAELL